jgi:hypothetical protein
MRMTKEEYIQTRSSDEWHDMINEYASQDLGRTFSLGAVQEAIMEEYNNDVYNFFEQKFESMVEDGEIEEIPS